VRLATWNVNSLRVRLPHLLDWLDEARPDVLGLQELKCTEDQFPFAELAERGYQAVVNGQKTYNGVALLARQPLEAVTLDLPGFADEQRRVITASVGPLRVINAYVVNGQALDSDKYAYKQRFFTALRAHLAATLDAHPETVLMGDFNVAPTPEDTHDPAVWEGQILCSEPERAAFRALLEAGLVDAFEATPEPEGRFTWWDYRQAAFRRNLGLRIDHLLVSQALAPRLRRWWVDKTPRKRERPSDHAPVLVELA
jgi:exodeoxyribonuclease-3